MDWTATSPEWHHIAWCHVTWFVQWLGHEAYTFRNLVRFQDCVQYFRGETVNATALEAASCEFKSHRKYKWVCNRATYCEVYETEHTWKTYVTPLTNCLRTPTAEGMVLNTIQFEFESQGRYIAELVEMVYTVASKAIFCKFESCTRHTSS